MLVLILLAAALVLSGVARAGDTNVATLRAVEDLSLPFWCDWGYDWDERCYWDDSDRLGVGGVSDKVWRGGIRFSLDGLPRRAVVVAAELALRYDRTCVAPRGQTRSCDGSGFELDVHPIFTSPWRSEREVDFGPRVARAVLEPNAPARWLRWDVTDIVAAWHSGRSANHGVLVKRADGEESFDSSGPSFPSSSHANTAVQPRLRVWFRG